MIVNYLYEVEGSDHDKCLVFANDCYETNKDEYARRAQSNPDKVVTDIVIGKLAEIAVYRYFEAEVFPKYAGYQMLYPDFTIYPRHKKTFEPDLVLTGAKGDQHIHVKSHRKMSSFPSSWLFQKKDRLVSSPQPHELLALCTVHGLEVNVQVLAKATTFKDKFSEPKMESLRQLKNTAQEKVALYYDDIIDLYVPVA